MGGWCRHCGRAANRARLRRFRRGWACAGCLPGLFGAPAGLAPVDRAFERRPPPDAVVANVDLYRRRAGRGLPLFARPGGE